jgi:hypothetical protein
VLTIPHLAMADKEKQASSKQNKLAKLINYELCTIYLSGGAQFFKLQRTVGSKES